MTVFASLQMYILYKPRPGIELWRTTALIYLVEPMLAVQSQLLKHDKAVKHIGQLLITFQCLSQTFLNHFYMIRPSGHPNTLICSSVPDSRVIRVR